jgi:AraC-like DNA-binding protein
VLGVRTLLHEAGVEVFDVVCSHRRGRGDEEEVSGGYAVVLVRRGCFVRAVDGCETLLDPTLAYCMSPGEEQRYDHPHDGGDVCTSLALDVDLLASLWGGDPQLPSGSAPISSAIDVEHRLLLSELRRSPDRHASVERAIALTAATLEQSDKRRVASGRPATARARRALSDGARELLACDVDRSLPELARLLAVSPHHLSRAFHQITGQTIARHRMRLRVRDALERIAGGERSLARVAADAGFADQSHLCRVVGEETGMTPSALRRMLV